MVTTKHLLDRAGELLHERVALGTALADAKHDTGFRLTARGNARKVCPRYTFGSRQDGDPFGFERTFQFTVLLCNEAQTSLLAFLDWNLLTSAEPGKHDYLSNLTVELSGAAAAV
jgi:hypothetical protein